LWPLVTSVKIQWGGRERDYPTKSRLNTSQHSPYRGIASAYLRAALAIVPKGAGLPDDSIVLLTTSPGKASFCTSCFLRKGWTQNENNW
jgi:hypothetical protein